MLFLIEIVILSYFYYLREQIPLLLQPIVNGQWLIYWAILIPRKPSLANLESQVCMKPSFRKVSFFQLNFLGVCVLNLLQIIYEESE